MSFNPDEFETYLPHTKALRDFLTKYDEDAQVDPMKFEDCGGRFLYCTQPHKPTKSLAMFLSLRHHQNGNSNFSFICPEEPADYRNRGELESDMGVRKACRFSRTVLGPCSGLEDREFGYKEGKPCVIVKLNRIVNFRPRVNVITFRVVLPLPDVFILYSWPADIVNLSGLSVCPRILPLFTFFHQPPSSNDTIPEDAQHKVQPNVIPLFCTNRVPLCSLETIFLVGLYPL